MKITIDLPIEDAAKLLEWAQTAISAEITLVTEPEKASGDLFPKPADLQPVRKKRRTVRPAGFWLAIEEYMQQRPELGVTEVAFEYGVSETVVRQIAAGKHWSQIRRDRKQQQQGDTK